MSRPSAASDKGLAGERTSLAWSRIGMSLLAVPSAMLGWSAGHHWVAMGAAAFAAVLGLAVLTISLRRQRVDPEGMQIGNIRLASGEVILAGTSVVFLCVAGLLLVAS